jgi:RsiW-degrading membrane proteinase PrsW (M82 family)
MEKITAFFKSMLSGTGDGVSSKRVITFLAFLLCAIAFVCNIFLDIPLKDYVWNGMLYLVGAGLGFTTLEQFAKK